MMKNIRCKDCITYKEIRKQLNRADFKKFCKWMDGQTTPAIDGVFKWDWKRFRDEVLKGKSTYFD